MADADAQHAWIKRVLGVDPKVSGGGGMADLSDALAAWRDALETVNGQVSDLQKVLRASPDDELHDIAEFGLNAMTGNYRIKLQAALLEAPDNPVKAAAASRLAGSFAAHIAADKRIAASDANPFGVSMSIRATLGPALAALQKALQTA